jgi:hypothetical protein
MTMQHNGTLSKLSDIGKTVDGGVYQGSWTVTLEPRGSVHAREAPQV